VRFLSLLAPIAGCAGPDPLECGPGTREQDGACVPECVESEGNDAQPNDHPPVVVSTSPVSGDLAVDPATDRIEVVFSERMTDDAWSWVSVDDNPPQISNARYEDNVTNVVDAVLEPGRVYQIWVNSPSGSYASFADRDGTPAVAYPIVFATTDGSDPSVLAAFPPAVVSSTPAATATDVDPSIGRLEVTFGKDMDPGQGFWEDDDPLTAVPIRGTGFSDARTAYAEVELAGNTTYAVWIEDFEDAAGNDVAPWLLTFRTGPLCGG